MTMLPLSRSTVNHVTTMETESGKQT